MGQNTNACCTIRRILLVKGEASSELSCNTTMHSRRMAYMRCDDRTNEVFINNDLCDKRVRRILGYQSSDFIILQNRSLIRLAELMNTIKGSMKLIKDRS